MRLVASRDLFFGGGLGLALDGHAFLDQGLEYLAAFFLRLGERAQAGQPDLLGRFLDGAGEWAAVFFSVAVDFWVFLTMVDSRQLVGDEGTLSLGPRLV